LLYLYLVTIVSLNNRCVVFLFWIFYVGIKEQLFLYKDYDFNLKNIKKIIYLLNISQLNRYCNGSYICLVFIYTKEKTITHYKKIIISNSKSSLKQSNNNIEYRWMVSFLLSHNWAIIDPRLRRNCYAEDQCLHRYLRITIIILSMVIVWSGDAVSYHHNYFTMYLP